MQRDNSFKHRGRAVGLGALLLVALLLMAGCGPRATGGELAAASDGSEIVVDLPALVIDIQPDGQARLGEQSLADLGALLGQAQALQGFAVPPETVDFLVGSNIQHIQIDNTPQGLLILVNGQPIPSLAWDGEKLVATAEMLETFGGGVTLLDKLLPLITQLGIGVTLRFPTAEGAEAIPLVAADDQVAAQAIAAQQEFLEMVQSPPTFMVTIQYAEDGTWSVADLSQQDLVQLAPVPLDMLTLNAQTIQAMGASGIDQIELQTNPDGIFILINGQALPYITWADGRVNHLLQLAEQTGLLASMLGNSPNTSALIDTVESLLPAVQASNVSLRVEFP